MNNTKTYIFIICTIIITAGWACNPVMEPSAETGKLEQLQEEYGQIGKQHNESLDHVLKSYDQLKKGDLSPVQIRNHTLDHSRRQLGSYYEVEDIKRWAAKIHDREAARVIGKSSGSRGNTASKDQSYFARTLELPGLKEDVRKYVEKLGKIIDSGAKPAEIEDRIQELLEEAESELSDESFTTVFLAAKVGISSTRYWDENGEKWLQKVTELKGNEDKGQDTDPRLHEIMYKKNIIKSDIAGAVGGAVASAVTGCAQITLGACAGVGAAAGGLSGSAAAAVQSYLDYIWESEPIDYPDLETSTRQVQTNAIQ